MQCHELSYEAVRDCEAKCAPALATSTRPISRVHGQWRYLYRAIDRWGALVDVMFSEHRDMAAAKAFFGLAKMVTGITPDRARRMGTTVIPARSGRR
jgi:putative transposase